MRFQQLPALLLRRILAPFGLTLLRASRCTVFAWFPDGRVVPSSPPGGFFYQPCVHPEGSDVIYYGNLKGPLRIWRTVFGTGRIDALSPADSTAVHPAYSWDGARIAFASDRAWDGPRIEADALPPGLAEGAVGRRFDIYVCGAGGEEARRLTSGESADRRPCFSPDGRQIAFISDRAGESDLWLLDVDDPREPRCLEVARQGYSPRRPWFAPDGSTVYFCGQEIAGPRHRICSIPATGGQARPLPNDTIGMSHGPFADPAGKVLLVHHRRGGPFTPWEIPLDGAPMRPLAPPGFTRALHVTRSRTGVITFDLPRFKTVGIGRSTRRPSSGGIED